MASGSVMSDIRGSAGRGIGGGTRHAAFRLEHTVQAAKSRLVRGVLTLGRSHVRRRRRGFWLSARAENFRGRSTRSTASRRPCGGRRRRRRAGSRAGTAPSRPAASARAARGRATPPPRSAPSARAPKARRSLRRGRARCGQRRAAGGAAGRLVPGQKRRAPLGGARQRYAVHSAQYGACSAHSSARAAWRGARSRRWRARAAAAGARRPRSGARQPERGDRRREDARQRRAAPRHPQQPRREHGRQDREGAIRRELAALALVARVVAPRRRLAREHERDVEQPERQRHAAECSPYGLGTGSSAPNVGAGARAERGTRCRGRSTRRAANASSPESRGAEDSCERGGGGDGEVEGEAGARLGGDVTPERRVAPPRDRALSLFAVLASHADRRRKNCARCHDDPRRDRGGVRGRARPGRAQGAGAALRHVPASPRRSCRRSGTSSSSTRRRRARSRSTRSPTSRGR